jgi:topoisomerase-4 subunit A
VYNDGSYETAGFELTRRFEVKDLADIVKLTPETVISAVYFDGNKEWTMVKRFHIETNSTGQKFSFISEHKSSKLYFASTSEAPVVKYSYKVKNERHEGETNLAEFIDVKGWKALGNKLGDYKLLSIKEKEGEKPAQEKLEKQEPKAEKKSPALPSEKLHPGDTVEFDVDKGGQTTLF